jgi:hypothetical protein
MVFSKKKLKPLNQNQILKMNKKIKSVVWGIVILAVGLFLGYMNFYNKPKPRLKPEIDRGGYGLYFRDTTNKSWYGYLVKAKFEFLRPDSEDMLKNTYGSDSAYFYGADDSTKRFRAKDGKDSFGVKPVRVPPQWCIFWVDTAAVKHTDMIGRKPVRTTKK